MRIGIDCRLAGREHAGIGRYISQLVNQLIKGNHPYTLVLFFSSKKQAREVLDKDWTDQGYVELVVTPVAHYSVKEQVLMPFYFYRARLDLLHVPHFNVPIFYFRPMIVTIHDLLWHHHRGAHVTTLGPIWYWLKYLFYRLVVFMAVLRAKRVLCPSHQVAKTIKTFYPWLSDKISVTYEGVDPFFLESKSRAGQVKPSNKTSPKSLLYVGSLYPHKNVKLVLLALKKLPNHHLTIISARTVFSDQVKKLAQQLGVDARVTFISNVHDQKLRTTYQNSWALIQPSLSEGFGLTGLEAMAAKTAVLASDIPVFREVYDQAASFFDPHQVSSLVKAIKTLTPEHRDGLIKKGHQLARNYSWEKTAQLTLKNYAQFLQR